MSDIYATFSRDDLIEMNTGLEKRIAYLEQRLAAAEAKLTETEKALRWACNTYIVDDYYTGDLRKERLERAVRYAMKEGRLEETSGSEVE